MHKLGTLIRFHDLGHTFASMRAANGATEKQVQADVGHRDARSTAIYSHLFEGHDDDLLTASTPPAPSRRMIVAVLRLALAVVVLTTIVVGSAATLPVGAIHPRLTPRVALTALGEANRQATGRL